MSVAWDGSDRKVVLARATPQTVLSPDGAHVLSRAGARRHVYLFERPQVADSVTIDPTAAQPAVPIRRLTRAGGIMMRTGSSSPTRMNGRGSMRGVTACLRYLTC